MDTFFSFLSVVLIVFSLYLWNKYRNPFFKWAVLPYSAFLVKDIWQYIRFNYLDLSFQTQFVMRGVELTVTTLSIVSLLFLIYLFRERKTTFRTGGDFKFYRYEDRGLPMSGSINTKSSDFQGKSKFPFFLQIYYDIEERLFGLPRKTSYIRSMDSCEEDVEKEIRSVCDACFIGRVDYNNIRYVYYYISDDTKAQKLFEAMVNTTHKKPITFRTSIIRDEKWQYAEKLIEKFGASKTSDKSKNTQKN